MKKLFFTLLTLCLCGTMWAEDFSSTVNYADGTSTTFYYNYIVDADGNPVTTVINNVSYPTVEVTHSSAYSASKMSAYYYGDIVIPEFVSHADGGDAIMYAVTGIGDHAFRNAYCMKSLTIPSTIQYIDDQACAYMGGAASADPDENTGVSSDNPIYMIVTIEGGEGVSPLEIKKPASSTNTYAFKRSYIDTLYVNRNIVLEDGMNIQYAPFHDNVVLKTAVFGEGVTDIIDYFCDGCTILTSVTLPEGLTSIGTYAFYGTAIDKIVIPSTVTTIGKYSFKDIHSLNTIILLAEDPGDEVIAYEDFEGEDATIYVPRGCAAAYYASQWQTELVGQHSGYNFNFYDLTTIREDSGDGEGTYYATYYYDGEGEGDYTYEIDDTSKLLYAVTGVKDGEVVKEQLNGDIIPKNTPLLIESSTSGAYYMWRNYYETDDEGNSTPFYEDGTPTTISNVPTNNMLYGHSEAGYTSVNGVTDGYKFYKLSLDPDATKYSIGFYYGAVGGVSYEAGAHRCWLAVPTDSANGADVISIKKSDEGDTTGISSIESASEAKVSGIYTIQGIRVSNMNQPGLYIVDGKKVLVK